MVEMQLVAVRVELPSNTPVLLLEELGGRRTLPVFVGTFEATAITYALQGIVPPRPMTHDLMHNLLETLTAEVLGVYITELRESTYFAEVHVRHADQIYVVSSRPSDAIALALRCGASIYADDDLIEAQGVILSVDDDADEDSVEQTEELVSQFLEFINEVRPEDFSPGE